MPFWLSPHSFILHILLPVYFITILNNTYWYLFWGQKSDFYVKIWGGRERGEKWFPECISFISGRIHLPVCPALMSSTWYRSSYDSKQNVKSPPRAYLTSLYPPHHICSFLTLSSKAKDIFGILLQKEVTFVSLQNFFRKVGYNLFPL